MKALLKLCPLVLLAAALPASAVLIGLEDFSYADGPIDGATGGSGFNYNLFTNSATGSTADWDNVGGAPEVTGGALTTSGSSAFRQYNGPLEGSGGADAGDDEERSGAVRGIGQVFYSVELTRSASAAWSGISSYDFGAERIFFGVPGAGGGTDTIGIDESGVATTLGSINLLDGATYTLVAVVDFDNDLLGLFVDPDGSDFWNPADGSNSADVSAAYGGTNWSTAARLGSGGDATWDNLAIATAPGDIGLGVPEPSLTLLGGLAGLFLLRRRR